MTPDPFGPIPAPWRARLPFLYALAFAAAGVLVNASYAIRLTDTDLWYHLAIGGHIAETGRVPTDSYFSFLTPPRAYLDYYWLFQLFVHHAHASGGFLGLVAARTALYGAVAACVLGLLFADGKRGAWRAFLAVMVLAAIVPRCLQLRPHLAEYLGIAFFLFVLEVRRGWAPWLPVVAALWGNVHGISFPVLLWICGCYAAERLLRRRDPVLDDRTFGLLAVSMGAVFLTPLGAGLLDRPFMPVSQLSHWVEELHRVTWRELATFVVAGGGLTSGTCFNVLLSAGALSAVGAGLAGKARVSHLLLFAGGAALVSGGQRFYYEMALLSLPLLREHPPFELGAARWRAAGWLAAAAAAAVPFVTLAESADWRTRYPVSERDLPRGVASFLLAEGGGGRLFHGPNAGGYYLWRLFPRYKITMDMQIQTLFPETDLIVFVEAFKNADTLKILLDKYRPEFLASSRSNPGFADVVKRFPEFVPVFLDESDVLYASRVHRPELARRWKLPVDPYRLHALAPGAVKDPAGWEGCQPRFLARLLRVDPENLVGRLAASRICAYRGDFAAAQAHARALIAAYPEVAVGPRLLGEALEGAGRPAEALAQYRRALRLSDEGNLYLHARMAAVLEGLGRRAEAQAERLKANPGLPPLSAELEMASKP
ncbi:MAG: tetratricopeptide repeat protein [Elusimicrobia bacterium]|nr:tetratricopeptide repeat protein [Elusimicrobiota bacterium]